MLNNLLQLHLKLLQKNNPKSSSYLIANKITNEITKVSRNSPQNTSETVTDEAENVEHNREIPKERSQKIKQKTIDDLRFI